MADLFSPLRRAGADLYGSPAPVDQAAMDEAVLPRAQSFQRGLRSAASGLGAGAFANEALRAELAGDAAAQQQAMAAMQQQQGLAQRFAPLNDYRQIGSVSDAVDYATGAAGSGLATLGPVVAGGLAGRFLGPAGLRGLSAAAGALVPSYQMNRGEQVAQQYADPEVAALPAERRDAMATLVGGGAAALDAIVPGGVAARTLRPGAGSLLRQAGRDALVEGGTEVAQTALGQQALGQLNPGRSTAEDGAELINAALQGAVGGGTVSLAGGAPGALMDRLSRFEDRLPPASPMLDPKASTADIARQLGSQEQTPEAFEPARLKQMSDDVLSSMTERVQSMFARDGVKRSDMFDSVAPEDMDAARELLRKHADPSRLNADTVGNLQTALSMMLSAVKNPDARLDTQKLQALGSEPLFDQVRDPDALIADIAAYTGSESVARMGRVRTAEQDVRRADNFIYTNMTPQMRESMRGPQLRALAREIDSYIAGRDIGRQEGRGKNQGADFRRELRAVFGSSENVDNVLDYYEKAYRKNETAAGGQIRGAAELEADTETERTLAADDFAPDNAGPVDDQTRDARNRYVFSNPRQLRPFVGKIDFETLRATGRLGDRTVGNAQGVEKATMLDYVREMGLDPAAEAKRLFDQSAQEAAKADREFRSAKDDGNKAIIERRGKGHRKMQGLIADAMKGGEVVDPDTGEILSPAEVALSKMTLLRTKELGGDDQAATPDDIGQMARGVDAANNKKSVLTFQGPDGRPLRLNARAMLKYWKRRGGTEGAGGESDSAYALRQLNSAIAGVVAAGYTLDSIPADLKIGQIGGVQRTYGDIEVASRKKRFESAEDPTHNALPRSDLEREVMGEAELSTAERLRALRELAAGGDLQAVLDTAQEVQNALKAEGQNAPNARKRELRAEWKAYSTLFRDLREDAMSADREGVIDAQVGGETLRGQDPAGVRRYQEETTESLQVMQDTADTSKRVKRVRPRDPERTKAKLAPTSEGRKARSSGSGLASGAPKQVLAPEENVTKWPEGDVRFSEMVFPRKGQKPLTAAEQQQVAAEIARRVGPKVKVAFKKMAGAGSFEAIEQVHQHGKATWTTTERLIHIASNMGVGAAHDTAAHEATHALFSMLRQPNATRQMLDAAAMLERVAMRPDVQKQLAALLKNHPKALKQAQTDWEEAAAYMFQFWQAGAMQLAPAPRNWFEKVAQFIREVLGIVSAEEKAVALMRKFDNGELADESTVGAVLRDMKQQTAGERARNLLGPVFHVAEAVLVSTTDRLRQTNVPALRTLADEFHRETDNEGGRLSFVQRRARVNNKAAAELNRIFTGVDAKTEKQAIDALQSRTTAASPEAEKLRQEVRKFLDDMHGYLRTAGVKTIIYERDQKGETIKRTEPLRKVKDYFPRAWDREAIKANEGKFKATLAKYVKSAKTIDQVFESLTGDDKIEIADGVSYTPYFQAAAEIKLDFINAQNAAEFAEFQEKDMRGILSRYAYQATHRGEYARQFGNEGERIEELIEQARKQGASGKDIAMARTATEALLGTLGHDMNPRARDLMTNILVYQNVVLLPFALLNNFMDVVGIGVRAGDLTESWNALKTGLTGLANDIRRRGPGEAEKLAAEIGLIDDVTAIGAYGYAYEGAFMKGLSKKVSDTFFKLNGMQSWNRSMRVAGMMTAQNFIKDHTAKAQAGDEQSVRFLKELNLTPSTAKVDAQGNLKVRIKDGLTPMQAAQMQEAIFRFVDGGTIRPNAAHRPIWGSDPRYMLIFHLKQFTFSFQQVMLRFVAKEAENQNMRPFAALMAYVPFAIFTDTFKAALLGRNIDTSLGGIMTSALKNSALVGTGSFGIDAFADLSKNTVPGASFAGPTAGHVLQTLQTLSGSAQDSYHDLLLRSLPGGPVARALGAG